MFNVVPVTIYGHCDGATSPCSRSAALSSWHGAPQQTGSAWARRRRARSQQTPHVPGLSLPLSQFFLAFKNLLSTKKQGERTKYSRKKKSQTLKHFKSTLQRIVAWGKEKKNPQPVKLLMLKCAFHVYNHLGVL